MTTSSLRKKLADYIQVADTKKVKAMYALLEDDIIEQDDYEVGINKELLIELDCRSTDMKNGVNIISIKESDSSIGNFLNVNK